MLNSWIFWYRLALITLNLETAHKLICFMMEVWLLKLRWFFFFLGQWVGVFFFLKQLKLRWIWPSWSYCDVEVYRLKEDRKNMWFGTQHGCLGLRCFNADHLYFFSHANGTWPVGWSRDHFCWDWNISTTIRRTTLITYTHRCCPDLYSSITKELIFVVYYNGIIRSNRIIQSLCGWCYFANVSTLSC